MPRDSETSTPRRGYDEDAIHHRPEPSPMPRCSPFALSLAASLAVGLGTALIHARPGARLWAATAAGVSVAPSDSLTAPARAQLAAARRAVASLATPEAAIAAGYRPMFGHVPLQGEHYVRVDLVMAGTFDVERPSALMFSPIAGKPALVGAAYALLHPEGEALPAGFDGAADAWHVHEGLAQVAGKQLVMTHVWFVDAPGGPFARYNPTLPYLAAGLAPPTAALLADSAAGERARRLGLALASVVTPPLLFEWIERRGGAALRSRTAPHRAAIEALVPRLASAERAGDSAGRERLAAEATRHAESLVAAYRGAVPERPLVARLVDRTVDEFLGRGHGVEEELGALFGGAPARRHTHEH